MASDKIVVTFKVSEFGFSFYGKIVVTFVSNSHCPPVCFASGTLIRTTRGDVAVEDLAIGDRAVTASGEVRPIVWLGHRNVDCRQDEAAVNWPVRIAEHAFGPNKPERDLYVSPGHAICVDVAGEVLIPASSLVNGSTVARVEADEVTYWHVELESHDILVANGLPAESYIDTGNRAFFDEAGARSDRADGEVLTNADYCRPLHVRGLLVEAVRAQLAARALADGWTQDREAGLELVVDGASIVPFGSGDTAILLFPAAAKDVRIVSKTFVPADCGGDDPRRLGISISGMSVSASAGDPRRVALDVPALAEAFYATERENGAAWRWTKGDIVLPRELWAGLSGQVALHLSYESTTLRGWVAPRARTQPMLRMVA